MVLASAGTACTLSHLLHHFGWTLAKGALDRMGSQENTEVWCTMPTRPMHVCFGKGNADFQENC